MNENDFILGVPNQKVTTTYMTCPLYGTCRADCTSDCAPKDVGEKLERIRELELQEMGPLIRVDVRSVFSDVSVTPWQPWREIGTHLELQSAIEAVQDESGCTIQNMSRDPGQGNGIWEPIAERAMWQVRFVRTDKFLPRSGVKESPWDIRLSEAMKDGSQ